MSLVAPVTGFEPAKKLKDRTACEAGTSLAILELIRRQSRGEKLGHREVAARYGIAYGTLRSAFVRWKKGQIKLKGFDRPEDLLTDERGDLIRDMASIRALKDGLSGMIARVVDAAGKNVGQMTDEAYKALGVGKIIRDLKDLEALLDLKRKALVRMDRQDGEAMDFVRETKGLRKQVGRVKAGLSPEPVPELTLNPANALDALEGE